MNLAPEIENIVLYIKKRSEHLALGSFTYEQLACYVAEKIKENKLLVVFNGSEANQVETIIGAIVFNPAREGKFYVEQLWADNKTTMKLFLKMLKDFFPEVKIVYGQRSNSTREVAFKLSTLEKIYGR
jgi:hypothetical protein